MTDAGAPYSLPSDGRIGPFTPLAAALILIGAATALRIGFLFLSPLELYPDEAQYWVWSRHMAFGYFSKPPVIAWLIRATTAIGGDDEAWIRLSAPILHAVAALALYRAGRLLYGPREGFWAATLYTLTPGVLLSSAIIATDAPLMACVALAVWAYAGVMTAPDQRRRLLAAIGFGAALGLGFLTKYAALYVPCGVLLHVVLDQSARRRWPMVNTFAALAVGLLVAAPNIGWNIAHHFQTVAHTAENADINGDRGVKGLFGARGPFGFLLGQFGVFGPIPFGVFLLSLVSAVRRRARPIDLMLLCLAAPAFVIVLGEAIIARANANWAGAAYPPAIVLVAGLLCRPRARRWLTATAGLQGACFFGFFIVLLVPGLADRLGVGNALKRARGWKADAHAIVTAAERAKAQGPLSAIAVDDRFMFNALSYYARDAQGRPAGALAAPLSAWVRLARAENQAEAEAPLTVQNGQRVLAIGATPSYLPAFKADFSKVVTADPPRIIVALDPKHGRAVDLFLGKDFQRQPRDPVSGRPMAR